MLLSLVTTTLPLLLFFRGGFLTASLFCIFQTLPTTTYELEIVAKDMAGSEVGLTGTATATITITDKNDHAPEFTHPLVRNIPFFYLIIPPSNQSVFRFN